MYHFLETHTATMLGLRVRRAATRFSVSAGVTRSWSHGAIVGSRYRYGSVYADCGGGGDGRTYRQFSSASNKTATAAPIPASMDESLKTMDIDHIEQQMKDVFGDRDTWSYDQLQKLSYSACVRLFNPRFSV